MKDIYFYEAFEEEAAAIDRYLPDHVDAGYTWQTIQEAGHSNPPARLISIRTQSIIPPKWATEITGILSRSTGYDHVLAYRKQVGTHLPCGHLPLYCHRAVAEQTMMMWMMLLRKAKLQMKSFKTFHRDGLTGQECAGKNLVVVGVGNIGSEICKIGQGLGMHVYGVDLVERHSHVKYLSLSDAIEKADVLVCAMNLTENNGAYFTPELLSQTPKGCIFVNISRGELSPMLTLHDLLQAGHLGGVGLDVYNQEKLLAGYLRGETKEQPKHPEVQAVLAMMQRDDVICTPHNAFNSEEGVQRKASQSVESVLAFLDFKQFKWPV